LGNIESIDGDERLRLKVDSGRAVELDPSKHPHLDHGYAMTSHSSQGTSAYYSAIRGMSNSPQQHQCKFI
jgi:hypothetical protein